MLIAAYLCLIVYFSGIGGVPPPGLISLRKCNEYYNLNVPEKNSTPLTEQALNNIIRDEWDYSLNQVYRSGIGYVGYVAGGRDAEIKELPFMAALGYDNGQEKRFGCGGTLISEEFVITAAHCLYSLDWGEVKYIRLGDLNLKDSADDIGVQVFLIKEKYAHPDYKSREFYHDIALIQLNAPARFTEYVAPACLEPRRRSLKGQQYYAAGWGLLGYGEDASAYLQIVSLVHYPDKTCRDAYIPNPTIPEGVKPESQICAGNFTDDADTCKGDSGGPLAYKLYTSGLRPVFMLGGITSFGKVCGLGRIPAVYTRVSYYTDWIERTIWPNELAAFDRG